MVVTEIGTDHDQGFRPAPQHFKYFGDLVRRGIARHQRHQGKVVEDALQEGQVNLEAVFVGMGRLHHRDLG